MLLSEFVIKNFKSIKSMVLPLSRLNIFIGKNNTGKSSIIQLLALLNQASQLGADFFPYGDGSNLILGDFKDLVHKGSRISNSDQNSLSFGFTIENVKAMWTYTMINPPYCELTDLKIKLADSTIEAKRFDRTKFLTKLNGNVTDSPKIRLGNRIHETKMDNGDSQKKLRNIRLFNNYMADLSHIITNFIYVPPFRGIRGLSYDLAARMPDRIGSNDPEGFEKNIVNILNKVDAGYQTKLNQLNEALSILNIKISAITPEVRDKETVQTAIKIEDTQTGMATNLVNTGFGTNQVIATGIALLYNDEPSLVGIEEPEIHLHPSSQADMFDFINELRSDNQILVTTHSEHFLTRLQRRIAEGKVTVNEVKVFWVDKKAHETIVTHVPIDKDGVFPDGLQTYLNFLEEEIKAINIARERKRRVRN